MIEGLIEGMRIWMALSEMGKERLLEAVVHYSVELITLEPLGGIVPDFADDIGVGFHSLYGAAELRPKTRCYLVGNVQSPSVK